MFIMKTGYLYSVMVILGCTIVPLYSMLPEIIDGGESKRERRASIGKVTPLDKFQVQIFAEVQRAHEQEVQEERDRVRLQFLAGGVEDPKEVQEKLRKKLGTTKKKLPHKKRKTVRAILEKLQGNGLNALHIAVINRGYKEVVWCLDNDSSIDTLTGDGRHVLFLALDPRIKPVDAKIVELLIQEDANFRPKTRFLKTADKKSILHMVAGLDDYDLFKFVFDRMTDELSDEQRAKMINACTRGGFTPLHYAAARGNHGMVEFLINAGASESIMSCGGLKAMDSALLAGKRRNFEVFLHEIPAPERADTLDSCLMMAVDQKSPVGADLASALGASSNCKVLREGAPEVPILRYAVEQCACTTLCKCSAVVTKLIARGAAVDAKYESSERTALHEAATFDKRSIARALLHGGAAVNDVVDADGYTPLHEAAEQGHKEMAALLLHYGAGVHAVTHDGKTALDLARNNARHEVSQVLEDWMNAPDLV